MQDGYGKIIGKANLPTYLNTSGVFSIGEALNLARLGRYPGKEPAKALEREIFAISGNHRFIVPEGVSQLMVEMWSAGGGGIGSNKGGGGAYLKFVLRACEGEVLDIIVGGKGLGSISTPQGGIGGGGNTARNMSHRSASGAGASQLFKASVLIAVAGAGGGSGMAALDYGGDGAIERGGDGKGKYAGRGASKDKGGSGGVAEFNPNYLPNQGGDGSYLKGGDAGSRNEFSGSGGGAGYYGGGAGGADGGAQPAAAGGGSSYVSSDFTKLILAEGAKDGAPGGKESANWDGKAGYGANTKYKNLVDGMDGRIVIEW